MSTDNASSHYSITSEPQSTLQATAIEWPALRNHIPCIAHLIELAIYAFISSLRVKRCTKSWEAYERDQQCGENECIVIGMSQRLRKEGNARINKMSAMRPGLGKIIEKGRISWYFESSETDFHIEENATWIDYADTWSSKRVHWLSKSKIPHCGTTDHGHDDTLEFDFGVAWLSLPIIRVHPSLAPSSKPQWLLATLHNTEWMYHCEVSHGSFEAVLILDPVDVEVAHGYIASRHHSQQRHVWSDG